MMHQPAHVLVMEGSIWTPMVRPANGNILLMRG